jgi:hypothetical protein
LQIAGKDGISLIFEMAKLVQLELKKEGATTFPFKVLFDGVNLPSRPTIT